MASEQKKYEAFFKNADKDGSGSLTFDELAQTLRNSGYKGSDETLKNYFSNADISGDGIVTFDEYMVAMGQVPPEQHKAATLRKLFNDFDIDKSGFIDSKELQAIFKEMGSVYSEDVCQRLIDAADKDGSATLDYEEFIKKVFGY
ncbi:calmodulin-like protein 3 [Lingula anatina]|uniref:Calmodulin-like protein 3 n=1 Tax=Lingula anatina TaxID=7574 RepID=A0A1S3HQZ8_LINAN|nr:calmodulin-like protein 3 [Lingula anatina]|eukprot:XP_013388478.1 calmodulin-like protein 3 [Lingula anatina]